MSRTVKVVLSCMCGNLDDAIYGTNGLFRKECEKMAGGPIDFVSYAGKFLDTDGTKGRSWDYNDFLEECKTADVVVLDAWNHPPGFGSQSVPGWGTQRAQKSMALIARTVLSLNPFVKLFAELMGGVGRVAVHEFATPIPAFQSSEEIGAAIRESANETRVLVLDDSEMHREAAKSQLSRYKLALTGSYEVAEDWIRKHRFDAVLLDLMVPAPRRTMGTKGMAFVGREMPIGTFLVLLALKQGVKKIGLLTDTGHHDHPASACVDVFQSSPFSVGDVKIIISNQDMDWGTRPAVKKWDGLLAKLS